MIPSCSLTASYGRNQLTRLRWVAARKLANCVALAAGTLFALASALGSVGAGAQTVTIQTQGPSTWDSYSGVISASDGNFYAVSADEEYSGFTPADFGCPDQSANQCTFIDKITPSGMVTPLHTFETAGFGNNGGTPNSDGFGPTPLVEGPDGYLYGSANSGGSAGFGTIFKISTSGVFTVLFTFPNNGTALNPDAPDGAYPSRLIFGKDGNLYGTSQALAGGYNLFQVTTSGSLTIIATSIAPGDVAPQSIVQGSDGSFYAVNGIAFEQITLSGFVNSLHGFVVLQSQTMQPVSSLVEGPDQKFYGADGLSGSIFQVSSSGSLNLIYTLQPTDGQLISPELTLGSDGNFYGTTYLGGITTACPSMTQAGIGIGCGTFFQATSAGKFTTLYSFLGTSVDGAQPDGWLLQGGAGSFYGTFFNPSPTAYNEMFNLSLSPALPPPIQITFSPKNPDPNIPVTVNWSVLNAFSDTMQQCHGSLAGGPNNGVVLLGPLTGTLTGSVYAGTYSFTPTAAGTYTFVLNCGGIETGSGTVSVGNGVVILTTSPLSGGTVSRPYSASVQATGGTTPYTWGVANATPLPAGLTAGADSTGTLYITGTPTQFGNYTVNIGLVDSSTPQQGTTKTFQMDIASGLTLAPSLSSGQVGSAYNQTASANGGIGPYKWALASGTLPNGLTLNVTSGTISGTPTIVGNFNFSITVADSEGAPATVTQAYTVSTTPEPLTVEINQQFACTVHSLCTGDFTATGGKPPYTWTVIPQPPLPGQNPIYVAMPPTLTVSPDGSFSGVPLQYADGVNTSNIHVLAQVTDSEVPPVSASDEIFLNIASDLAITSIPLPPAYVGTLYIAPLPVATGGTPPYKWVIQAANSSDNNLFAQTTQGQLTTPNPSGGAVTIPGTYEFAYKVSDSETVPATFTMEASLTVLPTPVTSITTLTSSSPTAGTGMSVALTANVTATGGTPSGVVTFYNGSVSLGTETLNAAGTASITTTFSTPGVYTLTASYAGGGAITGSVSAPFTETVVTPTVAASFSPATLTIAPGGSGTLTITLTAVGYGGTVGFSCGALPAHVACSFAPPSLTIGAGQTATDVLTITTNSPSISMTKPPNGQSPAKMFLAIGLWPFLLLPLAGLRRRSSRLSRLLVFAILAAGLGALSGCARSYQTQTAPGTYSIPINLQLSGSTQNTSVSVTVQ